MRKSKEEPVSILFWLFAILVVSCSWLGLIPAIFLAIYSKSQTKRNFFRALLIFYAVTIALVLVFWGAAVLLGYWPEIDRFIRDAK